MPFIFNCWFSSITPPMVSRLVKTIAVVCAVVAVPVATAPAAAAVAANPPKLATVMTTPAITPPAISVIFTPFCRFCASADDGNMQLSVSLSHLAALHSGHSVKLDWRRILHCCSPRPIQRSPLYVPPVTIQDIP